MSEPIPLGRQEDQGLEVKSREVLKSLASVAREVAAMLNAGAGGEVWIGLVEEDEVVVGVEPVENAARERRRVEDALCELIEPAPGPSELRVRDVGGEAGHVLVVEVGPDPPRGPYALLRNGGRVYSVRSGARVRPMSRDDLRDAFLRSRGPAGGEGDGVEPAMSRLLERRERSTGGALLQVIPTVDQDLDLTREQREELADPARIGCRPDGWTYGRAFSRFEPSGPDVWRLERERSRGVVRTEIRSDGSLELLAPLGVFEHEHPGELYPYALLEYPTSALRLFRAMHALNPAPKPCACVVGLAFSDVHGWKLRPFSPRAVGYRVEHPGHEHRRYQEDVLPVGPYVVEWEELMAPDDRVALRLVRGVYRSFGYEDDAIPVEFDQDRAELHLPL